MATIIPEHLLGLYNAGLAAERIEEEVLKRAKLAVATNVLLRNPEAEDADEFLQRLTDRQNEQQPLYPNQFVTKP